MGPTGASPAECGLRPPEAYYRRSLNVLFFIFGLNFAAWASRIPDVQRALDLNDAELGTALFGAPLGQLPCMLAAGFLVNRFGSRVILAAGLALNILSLACLGFAESFRTLFISLTVFGISSNLFDIALNTQAVLVEKLHKRSIMASFHGFWSLGGMAGGLLGGVLAYMGIGPGAHFLGIGIPAAACWAALRSRLVPCDSLQGPPADKGIGHQQACTPPAGSANLADLDGPDRAKPVRGLAHEQVFAVLPAEVQAAKPVRGCAHERAPAPPAPRRSRLVRPDGLILLLALVAFGNMAAEGTMYDWIAVYFTGVLQAPEALTRLGYIVCMGAMVTARFLADNFITRLGAIKVLQAGAVLMCCGFALLIIPAGIVPATLGAALIGFGMASGIPICYSLAGRSKTIPPSIAISLVVFISFSGFMLCPPLIGCLSHAVGLRSAFIPMAALSFAVILTAPLLKKKL
ncbi:MAG: MFS transporter [Desulfovibrio sp.]|jgi:MFS family permease|nr:MFS transporter [Desulfovibrio sp.]